MLPVSYQHHIRSLIITNCYPNKIRSIDVNHNKESQLNNKCFHHNNQYKGMLNIPGEADVIWANLSRGNQTV